MHVQRTLQEALHFATPRTAQRCLGREFTAAVITSCTRRWEIALQASAGFSRNLGKTEAAGRGEINSDTLTANMHDFLELVYYIYIVYRVSYLQCFHYQSEFQRI